jgi:transposase
MNEKTNKSPSSWRELRRLQAWELSQKGWKQNKIAEALGVTEGAISQWVKKARTEGVVALYQRKGGGPKPRLTTDQIAQLPKLLNLGAEAYGFLGDVWTQARVRVVIKQEFGVSFSLSHIGRLLKRIGWTRQKPIARATQRNEPAIEQWRTDKWFELEKKPNKKDERSCL